MTGMNFANRSMGCLLALLLLLVGSPVWAQQVTTETPLSTVGGDFYERMGVGFDFNIRTGVNSLPSDDGGPSTTVGLGRGGQLLPDIIPFRQNSFGPALPGFGGAASGPSGRSGVAMRDGEGDAFFNFDFGQGSRRSSGMQAPVVTSMNGQPAQISDQFQTPFVSSVRPVVGLSQYGPSRLPLPRLSPQQASVVVQRYQQMKQAESAASTGTTSKRATPARHAVFLPKDTTAVGRFATARTSTAGQPAASLAAIQQQQSQLDQQQNQAAQAMYSRAVEAESLGKLRLAKNYYRMAARDATGDMRDRALAKVAELTELTRSSTRTPR